MVSELVLDGRWLYALEVLVLQVFLNNLLFKRCPVRLVKWQKAKDEAVKHEPQRPHIYHRIGLHIALQKLGGHEFQATKVDVFHSDAGYRAENAKVDHFKLYTGNIKVASLVILRWLSDHNILILHVSMYNFAVVAVVDCV